MARFNSLEKYGVKLIRLTEDKIELLRKWRNSPKISQYMEYREYITAEQQLKWFRKIDNESNYYFIICIGHKEIGCVNIRDIDYEKKMGEPGIFIWDDDYLNGTASFQTSLCMLDFCFYDLGLKKLIVHVLSDNKRAIQYNIAFGFKISEGQEGVYNQQYTLTLVDYESKKNQLIKYFL